VRNKTIRGGGEEVGREAHSKEAAQEGTWWRIIWSGEQVNLNHYQSKLGLIGGEESGQEKAGIQDQTGTN